MPVYSWVCPTCGRQVPTRMEICRCGTSQTDAVVIAPEGEAAVAAASSMSSLGSWLVLGGVTLAAAGGLIALQVVPVKSGPATAAGERETEPQPGTDLPIPAARLRPDATSDVPIPPIEPVAPAPVAPVAPPAPITPALEDVVSRSIPAIVSVESGQGRGSGFFAAPRTVITNRHVVQGYVSVTIRLSSGQSMPGRVETTSQEYDLAVVRVDGASPDQPVLPLGTVDEVRPGQEVIAIGLALGVFQNSVTRGIISAVRRANRTVMLQTDAAINPGNSGGPLLNRRGQVVGINTMKITGAAESLGFAVAVDHARGMLRGGRSGSPIASSAQRGETLAPALAARSATDTAREDGTRRYGQTVEAVARRASQLDSYWERIKANCPVRIASGYDREWFGIWDGRVTLTSPDASCGSAVDDLGDLAAEVRTVMAHAQEEARRAAVLPGQLRDIRRRYRMDWAGFER